MRVGVGIKPPKKIFNEILKIEKIIAKKYNTHHSLESRIGPHITLTFQPTINKKDFKKIEKNVNEISKKTKPFKIKIKGIARFYKTRTIYMKVLKSRQLNNLYKKLSNNLKQFGKIRIFRPFTSHMTIAYVDITKENFKKAFKELKNKKISYEFNVNKIYLAKSKPTERLRIVKSFELKF